MRVQNKGFILPVYCEVVNLCFPTLFQSIAVSSLLGAEKSCNNFMTKVVTTFD